MLASEEPTSPDARGPPRAISLAVVSTCPRVGVSYLVDTLTALEVEGLAYPRLVLSDGVLPELFDRHSWPAIERQPPSRSTRANLWDAFFAAVSYGVDQLLFFEDDIFPCRHAVARMARVRCPGDCAFISYLDLAQIPSRRVFGLHKFPAGGADGIGFWGLQACAFPRRTLEFLAAHDPYSIRTENKRRNGDRVVAQFLADSPWPQIAYHSPSLFRHVGEVSAAHADRIHPMPSVPLNYPGDQFDSLTLPAFTAGVLG